MHARIWVLRPVNRHLVDAQAALLRKMEKLRVEEPVLVLDRGKQRLDRLAATGLEAALSVAHAAAEAEAQQEVVRALDELALDGALHARAVHQARANRKVAVAAEERRDQGEERVEAGGEVDVHVREHVGLALGPCGAQRAAAA